MRCILFLFLLSGNLWGSNKVIIPDGAWNDKPWKKSHLLAEVKKGNPDALAEWAYDSMGPRLTSCVASGDPIAN